MSERLTYAEVAERIHDSLGEAPRLSALRAAVSREPSASSRRLRITAGMPQPIHQEPGAPTLFDADQITAWLKNHPRRDWPRIRDQLASATPDKRASAVAAARAAGMPWQAIVDVINTHDSTSLTRQWAQQKYGLTGP